MGTQILIALGNVLLGIHSAQGPCREEAKETLGTGCQGWEEPLTFSSFAIVPFSHFFFF